MAILTAQDFANQMIAQLRILDPNASAEIGTPERKIIDTVAQSLADNQIDLTGLAGALDIDSKYGANLDRFTALFGFQRQVAAPANGYVVFSTASAALADITIPVNTTLQSTQVGANGEPLQYVTTAGGLIAEGFTDSSPIPIQCITSGSNGNVNAGTITLIVGTTVSGVTAVTNPNALTNGIDAEDDNSYKVRFKNTWARNLAGTSDQYLALAIAGPYTTKANVIGYQSRYQEYTQVPDYDDAGYLNGSQVDNMHGALVGTQNTNGTQGQWTTALSSIPYAREIYTNTQVFVSNGQQGLAQFYYRNGVDFQFNSPPLVTGDTIRTIYQTTCSSDQTTGSSLQVTSISGLPTSGTIIAANSAGALQTITYSGLQTSPIAFTGTSAWTGTIKLNSPIYVIPVPTGVAPNFTMLNVFNPSDGSVIPGLQSVSPGDIILTEFSYISTASRNSIGHNITNAVDLYVNGSNDTQTTCVFLNNAASQVFNINPTSPWYYENYRRNGDPARRPMLGNYYTPLFQSPIDSLPDTITISGQNYYRGYHYYLVNDISSIGGSTRARDGIEWNKNLLGDTGSYPTPTAPDSASTYTGVYYPVGGTNISGLTGQGVEVDNYTFDANIPILQATAEDSKQICTDVLVHKASIRYFKLDITVMYGTNASYAAVNSAIGTAVQAFFDRQYFGSVIQLSDLLEIIHEVSGVDNVRWSNDIMLVPDLIRVFETDILGNPLQGSKVSRLTTNPAGTELQTLLMVGSPTGSFTMTWVDTTNLPVGHTTVTTAAIPYTSATDGSPITAATIQTAIRNAMTAATVSSGMYNNIVVAEDTRPTTNVARPIRSFTITYGGIGQPVRPTVTDTIASSTYAYNTDFFLLDNELPALPTGVVTGDTVPGVIIRPRAQSTFFRAGLG